MVYHWLFFERTVSLTQVGEVGERVDDAVDNDDDADDFVEVDVVVEGQIGGQLERPHQSHAVSEDTVERVR